MLIDISPPISESLAVWPSDVAFSRSMHNTMESGDAINLTSIQTTLHLGAHVDAERHYVADGRDVAQWPLERFIGGCRVLHVPVSRGGLVMPEHIPSTSALRVLLRTDTYPDSEQFNEDFAGIHPDTVDLLADRGVLLIGIDTPSVDRFADHALPTHQRFGERGVTILEGLRLGHVAAGAYELIALPLRITGGDGSPVRAVLRE
ncbi:MAG: kynurenine formamidase [Planctomycetes bacterium]|jgi:arylformamidase|nr:kynurenine formamidase [Planctomycetota bacterium]MCP4839483.1 kynurenine formamidase [Planctomycetota bacterium]